MNLSRNIVIEASAGTGKTYTLVQTILQALFQKNLPMDALVALTFTKKAAGEMKERIALELQKVERAEKIEDSWKAWGQPLDVLKVRAREALETIDRAAIGTIHSYAYPDGGYYYETSRGFVWADGVMRDLGELGLQNATAINNAGASGRDQKDDPAGA